MDNLEEMEKFLEMYNLLRLSQKEIENMIRPITSKGIKPVILKCPRNKSTGLHSFPGEFYQTFIRKVNTYPSQNASQKPQRKQHFQTHFGRFYITLIPKPDKDITEKEN